MSAWIRCKQPWLSPSDALEFGLLDEIREDDVLHAKLILSRNHLITIYFNLVTSFPTATADEIVDEKEIQLNRLSKVGGRRLRLCSLTIPLIL